MIIIINYNDIDLSLSYKTDSRGTPLRDLFRFTEDGKPLESMYTYSGDNTVVLELVNT